METKAAAKEEPKGREMENGEAIHLTVITAEKPGVLSKSFHSPNTASSKNTLPQAS
jgi:hypothetical protein